MYRDELTDRKIKLAENKTLVSILFQPKSTNKVNDLKIHLYFMFNIANINL